MKVSKSYAVGTVVLWQIKEYYVTGLPNKANLLPTVVKLSVFDNKSFIIIKNKPSSIATAKRKRKGTY